jgi:uncharacterized protein (DUF2249 family)
MNNKTITVDAREDIRSGKEPFSKIMNAVAALGADEQMLLIAPFEPAPLFSVLKRQGFTHSSRETESGDFEVLFTRDPNAQSCGSVPQAPPLDTRKAMESTSARSAQRLRGESANSEIVEVDARGLEPPQPMVRILEALATLPNRAELRARTDRRPMHLYAQLEERGFAAETEEQSDASFLTRIHRR